MNKQEKLFNEGKDLVQYMTGLLAVVQNEMPNGDEKMYKQLHNNMFRKFHMELIEWDEEVNKYLDWQISESKRKEESQR